MEEVETNNAMPEKAEKQYVKLVRKDPSSTQGSKRAKAMHSPRKDLPAAPRQDLEIAPIAKAEQVAADNATHMEFGSARAEIQELVLRSMSAAEAGVRIQSLFLRHPDLLANQLGKGPLKLEGARHEAVKRELLPLPLPRAKLVKPHEISHMFPSDEILGPKEKHMGAEAWQFLLLAALNGLDSHGNGIRYFWSLKLIPARALRLSADVRLPKTLSFKVFRTPGKTFTRDRPTRLARAILGPSPG